MGLLGGSQVCNGSGRPLAQGGLCVRSGWRHWAARPQVDRPRRGCYPHSLAGRLARPGWRSGCGVSCARGDMMGLWWERSSVLFISPRAESPSWGSSRPPSPPPGLLLRQEQGQHRPPWGPPESPASARGFWGRCGRRGLGARDCSDRRVSRGSGSQRTVVGLRSNVADPHPMQEKNVVSESGILVPLPRPPVARYVWRV